MTFISISDETYVVLKKLRRKGETDEAMIERILEYARCYMILRGMEE